MLRNIMSVVIGVIIAAALFSLAALIMLLTIASKVKGHGEESDLDGISKVFDVVSFLVIFTCFFIGGYITGRISTKKDMIHGAITGIVLIVLLAYASDFDKSTEAIIYYVVILPFTLIGTLMAVRVKKRKKLI